MKNIYLAAILAALALPASADDTGNKLASDCAKSMIYCVGYVTGVYDGMKFGSAIVAELARRKGDARTNAAMENLQEICLPSGVTKGQMADVVLEYIRSEPTKRHLDAGYLTFLGLREAFPCR